MLGEVNRMLILNYLRLHGDMTRSNCSRALEISFPANQVRNNIGGKNESSHPLSNVGDSDSSS